MDSNLEPITHQTRFRLREDARAVATPWQQPLGSFAGREPRILDEHVDAKRRGADFGYSAAPYDRELFVPVFAVQAGEVAMAVNKDDRSFVTIDHGNWTFQSHYAHLSKLFVTRNLGNLKRRQYVRAGEVIGYAAKAPIYVRFELWQWTDARGYVAVDPKPHLLAWQRAAMPERPAAIARSTDKAA